RTALSQAISARTPGANTLQQFFDPSSSIYPLIATLGGATDLEEIRRYAALPDRFESTIESLKAEIEALKSSNTQNELKRLQARRAMVEALSSAIDVARAFDLERYAELLDAYTRNKERRDKAGAKAFE